MRVVGKILRRDGGRSCSGRGPSLGYTKRRQLHLPVLLLDQATILLLIFVPMLILSKEPLSFAEVDQRKRKEKGALI
jgi:hypothetical protein